MTEEVRECRCMFCGVLLALKSEQEAMDHMAVCKLKRYIRVCYYNIELECGINCNIYIVVVVCMQLFTLHCINIYYHLYQSLSLYIYPLYLSLSISMYVSM